MREKATKPLLALLCVILATAGNSVGAQQLPQIPDLAGLTGPVVKEVTAAFEAWIEERTEKHSQRKTRNSWNLLLLS